MDEDPPRELTPMEKMDAIVFDDAPWVFWVGFVLMSLGFGLLIFHFILAGILLGSVGILVTLAS